jgi:hypothetical protein
MGSPRSPHERSDIREKAVPDIATKRSPIGYALQNSPAAIMAMGRVAAV